MVVALVGCAGDVSAKVTEKPPPPAPSPVAETATPTPSVEPDGGGGKAPSEDAAPR
jgi:hypothetical protein